MALDPNLGAPDDTQDPTAGGSGDGATAGTDPQGTPTPTPTPNERTYSRAEVEAEINRVVQERLARDRRDRPTPTPTPERAAPASDIPSWAQPLLRQNAVSEVRWQVQQMREEHKDFAANETAILELAAQIAEEHPGLTPTAALKFAYRTFGHEQLSKIDVEAIRKEARDKAIAEYSSGKKEKSERTPKGEGPGGSAPATTRKIATRKDFEDALEEGLSRVDI